MSTGSNQTFVFTQEDGGFAGFADTSIYSESENAGGGEDGIFSGTNKLLRHRRGLIRIDLSTIPADATIIEASLTLVVASSGANFGDFDIELHRLLASWGEGRVVGLDAGGFGGPPATGDATWISRFHGSTAWNTPGGDFAPMASASATAGRENDVVTWTGDALATDVQGWVVNPDANFGWLLMSGIEGQKQRVKKFYSSEAAPELRPVLRVVALLDNGATEVPATGIPAKLVLAIGLVGLGALRLARRQRAFR